MSTWGFLAIVVLPVQAQLEFSVAGMRLPYGAQLRAACAVRWLGWRGATTGRPGAGLQQCKAGVQAM
ncbi:TPA: hypothetical protein ACKP22_004973 [Pseudomonas putida]